MQVSILDINSHSVELSKKMLDVLVPQFAEFGISLDKFNFMDISVPEEDIKELSEIKKKVAMKKKALEATLLEGQVQAQIDYAKLRAQGAGKGAGAADGWAAMQAAGAQGLELEARRIDVMKTAAGNEGQVGGFMGAGMGIGMGVGMGGAFGMNMANMANQAFNPQGNPQQPYGQMPPQGYPQQPYGQMPPQGYAPQGAPAPEAAPAPAPAAAVCPNCGQPIQPGATVCSCGQQLQ